MSNKRHWCRVKVDFPAQARPLASGRDMSVRIVDINSRGVCFSGLTSFEPGNKIDITLEVREFPLLVIRTEVVWSGFVAKEKHYHTGVQLVDTPAEVCESFLRCYSFFLLKSGQKEDIL